jgi:hypothetical protein
MRVNRKQKVRADRLLSSQTTINQLKMKKVTMMMTFFEFGAALNFG